MQSDEAYTLRAIGFLNSEISKVENAPKQGYEGGVEADVEIFKEYIEGLEDVVIGDEIILITWLHESSRDVLKVHPRGDRKRALKGVFSTRSPNRPNPIGLHRVKVIDRCSNKLRVSPIEAINNTPVLDIKSVIKTIPE